jgi:hypothetical protein
MDNRWSRTFTLIVAVIIFCACGSPNTTSGPFQHNCPPWTRAYLEDENQVTCTMQRDDVRSMESTHAITDWQVVRMSVLGDLIIDDVTNIKIVDGDGFEYDTSTPMLLIGGEDYFLTPTDSPATILFTYVESAEPAPEVTLLLVK